MWLLDVLEYRLVEFINPDQLRYAILSHTWGIGEVSFYDIQCLDVARARPAWDKVQQTCRVALERGIFFVWIDTCCIDKRSSAELSEAINSMFAWYRGAAECYVHLADFDGQNDVPLAAISQCRWFTRGWTLQELIAPKLLYFYDCTWTQRGSKTSLSRLLSEITNIDEETLLDPDRLSIIPVARRMSWAATRQTTRPEDLAYCLLGLFGVNMPLIYGEGASAFLRLQEAIALATEDLSLFAWIGSPTAEAPRYSGILASSPSQFAHCHELENIDDPLEYNSRSFTMVNRCFSFQTCLMTDTDNREYLMRLHCRMPDRWNEVVVLRLIKTAGGFVRHKTEEISFMDQHYTITNPAVWDPIPRTLTIPKSLRHADLLSIRRRFYDAFHFKISTDEDWYHKLSATLPELSDETPTATHWDSSTSRYMTDGHPLFTGLLTGTIYDERGSFLGQFLVFFGFAGYRKRGEKTAPQPWIALSRSGADSPLSLSTSEENSVFDLPGNVLAEQHRMHYLRFTSYAGRFFRNELEPEGTRLVRDKMREINAEGSGRGNTRRLRTSMPNVARNVAVSVSLETLDAGDYTTHRVFITLRHITDRPGPPQSKVHVFDANGEPPPPSRVEPQRWRIMNREQRKSHQAGAAVNISTVDVSRGIPRESEKLTSSEPRSP